MLHTYLQYSQKCDSLFHNNLGLIVDSKSLVRMSLDCEGQVWALGTSQFDQWQQTLWVYVVAIQIRPRP